MNDRDPARAARFVKNLIDEEELARVDALSSEELARELEADGIRPEDIPSVEVFLKKANAVEPAVDIAAARSRRRTTWVVTLLAAAFGVAVVVVGIRSAPQIEAWWQGPAKAPDRAPPVHPAPPPSAPPTTLVQAAALRDEARQACDEALWGVCEQRLDDARALDPDGERSPDVAGMRRRIANGSDQIPIGAKPNKR